MTKGRLGIQHMQDELCRGPASLAGAGADLEPSRGVRVQVRGHLVEL